MLLLLLLLLPLPWLLCCVAMWPGAGKGAMGAHSDLHAVMLVQLLHSMVRLWRRLPMGVQSNRCRAGQLALQSVHSQQAGPECGMEGGGGGGMTSRVGKGALRSGGKGRFVQVQVGGREGWRPGQPLGPRL